MKYVGLTNNPERRKAEHGDPRDWRQKQFEKEEEARAWEADMLEHPGYQGGPGGKGWRYGYVYTITNSTIE